MITLANQRDDNWPISKYQETPAANQPLPTPCLCSKLINTAVHLGSGLSFSSTVLDVTGALARASNKPLYAFALLWMSFSLSFGDSDTGHNTTHSSILAWRIPRKALGILRKYLTPRERCLSHHFISKDQNRVLQPHQSHDRLREVH